MATPTTTADQFRLVAEYVSSGAWRAPLTNDEKLVLYALYKQATEGALDAERTRRPNGVLDPRGAAKYDAWCELGQLTREAAREAYIQEFHNYRARYGK